MSSFQRFSLCVLKWRKVLGIKIIFYVTGQKIKYETSCRGIGQVREEGRTKKIPLFNQIGSRSETEPNTTLVLKLLQGKKHHRLSRI